MQDNELAALYEELKNPQSWHWKAGTVPYESGHVLRVLEQLRKENPPEVRALEGFLRALSHTTTGDQKAGVDFVLQRIQFSTRDIPDCNYTQLAGHSLSIEQVRDGTLAPVGGAAGGFSGRQLKTIIDLSHLERLLQRIEAYEKKVERDRLAAFLVQHKINFDLELLAKLWAFTEVFFTLFKVYADPLAREEQYKQGTPLLSDIILHNLAECAEVALLAQAYLQRQGIRSTIVVGHILESKDDEFPGEHTFIYLTSHDQEFIFDASNPKRFGGARLPRIQYAPGFSRVLASRHQAFARTVSIYDGKEVFYGVGERVSVLPSQFIE
jgi:hypothetical protein